MISGGPNPPDKGPKGNRRGGDPVDLGTGLFVYDKTDLAEPGSAPIAPNATTKP